MAEKEKNVEQKDNGQTSISGEGENGGRASSGGDKKDNGRKSSKSLNQKIEELDAKVEWFYSDDFKLEEAVAKYKEALTLAKDVEKDLAELRNEIEVLNEDFAA